MVYYFMGLQHEGRSAMCVVILLASVLGILGSYGVAWFGIRINTVSNSRTAFSALKGNPLNDAEHPAPFRHERRPAAGGGGTVLHDLHPDVPARTWPAPASSVLPSANPSAPRVLRICGGIFTKIADIGSDLMKIVFKLPEDDPKNPGVIADCTGDNAGDSVGPTADGFETYGVTGVALIAFLALALAANPTGLRDSHYLAVRHARPDDRHLACFLFCQRSLSARPCSAARRLRLRAPLTHLVWLTSAVSIAVTFIASKLLLGDFKDSAGIGARLWWVLSVIISCGTVAGALIPEFTKVFVSTNSRHVKEVTNCSKHGGASLNILSGFVAGNFSAFWMGLCIMVLMFVARIISPRIPRCIALMPDKFAFAAPDLRLRPGGLRLPGHGTGDHRRGQLRPGDGQRPVGL